MKPNGTPAPPQTGERYRPLPTGMHGLDPEIVQRDQRERLRNALVELIAMKGYQHVRILDLAKLARVSQPTFYSLFGDKDELFMSAYDEISERAYLTAMEAYASEEARGGRLLQAMRAFTQLAAEDPHEMSLFVLGAFGAGPRALEHCNRSLHALEERIRASRGGGPASFPPTDLTIQFVLGGIREIIAARLSREEEDELPSLAGQLATWCASYPRAVPPALELPASSGRAGDDPAPGSERARQASGRLPSGRSDLPREVVIKSQQERIVDATAAIVTEKGLAGLTIPEIARRANVSHQTFYAIYPSKHHAFLGAQKVGMHQAVQMAGQAYEERMPDWPRAIAGGLRAVVDYLASEPQHAHLSIVDTFGASPETVQIRDEVLRAFATFFQPGYEYAEVLEVPELTAEAVVGGAWQILHHYIEAERLTELPAASAQLTYLLLAPFVGVERAAEAALRGP